MQVSFQVTTTQAIAGIIALVLLILVVWYIMKKPEKK